ncbi:hypothetical protein SELMODRAFT_409510 [Selaginella moellendorffii]|uniref:RRM domain-containing protein n=1 Tax=Selaginella moellendorffii TaxID=88036 RepID=D8RBP4_SELML|nr:U1 small nuclear ribonucleoprotein A [Selaginella moellendorffii]XP_002976093.1 U1 small nuclear ribonucleoprotein A [Selaginella moellendorffii]EFJ22998.1 hypothetical protein SELMODRAFT_175284 [Selaginella moellendorffii]EFJ30538.1 hypothetical protein SELMODRAFT_409510 [Selaginella moellendorffii]|eukprot:XP_002968284.1 U1 small nuclear ribonucleoprotein A [Selaginella moellendorffii]
MATAAPAPPAPGPQAQAQQPPPSEVPPNQTIYINNLNEKIKKDELVKSLRAVFSQFGNILDIVACKSLKLKGQAWVVFEDVTAATNALRQMQEFPFYDKALRIQYAKTKSDAVAKLDGTFIPKEKRKKIDEKAEKRKREHHESHSYHYPMRTSVPEIALPNNILFVQKLPHDTSSAQLQMLFSSIPGFKEVRMVDAKPGIAFVEYAEVDQASVAKSTFHAFRVNESPMHITYAKR